MIMPLPLPRLRTLALVIGVAALSFGGLASADPPSRVARLGYIGGAVSFSPAGENDWVQATINRPITTGDRLWVDTGARSEIEIGGAVIRMSAGTGVSVLNIDDRIAQLQLTQGTLDVRVRRLERDQVFEVDTPNLAFTLRQPGEYRIEVDADGNATTIVVRKGQGEVYGEDASYVVDSRQAYRFVGTGLRDYQLVDAPRLDEFDRWSGDRDRRYDNSASARYVSQDVVGYQDLDANGTWRVDTTYGNVWVPSHVTAGWAPYRDGHWAWIDPWGWTWVDDAPWGYAVSHYGRWTNMRGTWGWVPGPMRTQAYYAPALVAFVGGNNFQIAVSGGNVGGVAWFPLGPREVYRPSYQVSRGYFENVNRSNTVINTTVINNTYNNTNVTNVVYANRQVPGAVIAVPSATFVQSQPVGRAAVRVNSDMVARAPVAAAAPVAPTLRSVQGAAGSGDKPPARVFERGIIARTAPPAAPAGFAAQQQHLAATPGKPLDDATRRELKPAAAAPVTTVRVVAPARTAQPTALPPAAAPGARPVEARGRSDEVKTPAVPAINGTPRAPMQGAAPPRVAPPVTTAQPPQPEQRGRPDQRGNSGDQRAQPVAPPPAPMQRATPATAAPPQVAPPAPTAQPAQPAQPPEQHGRPDQRAQPVAPPPAPMQRATPTPAAPPQVAPPPPVAQPVEPPRGRPEQRAQPVAPPPAPVQRATPVPPSPPQVAPPAPVPQPVEPRGRPEQRAQPVAPPPAPMQRATPAPAAPQQVPPPAALPARPPVAAPAPTQAQPQPAPKAEPRPAAGKPNEKGKDPDEQKHEEDNRKQK
jgi:hypothetical protein